MSFAGVNGVLEHQGEFFSSVIDIFLDFEKKIAKNVLFFNFFDIIKSITIDITIYNY